MDWLSNISQRFCLLASSAAQCMALLLVLVAAHTQAQTTAAEYDSATYDMFIKEDWKNLAKTGIKANKEGISSYYLNARTGIALLQQQRYYASIRYLNRAAKQNNNDYVNQRLLWAYHLSGNTFQANEVFDKLDKEVQLSTGYKPKRALDFIYIEGGYKLSDRPKLVGNSGYAQLLFKHNITKNVHLLHGYTFLSRPLNGAMLYQHQYLIAPSFHIKNGWSFDIAASGTTYTGAIAGSNTNPLDTTTTQTAPNGIVTIIVDGDRTRTTKGDFTQYGGYFQAGFSKRFNALQLKAGAGAYIENVRALYNVTQDDNGTREEYLNNVLISSDTLLPPSTTTIDTSRFYWQGLIAAEVAYTFPFWDERLTIGTKVFVPFTSSKVFVTASPYISLRVAKRAWLSATYLYKQNYVIADNGGVLLLNNFDTIHARTSLTATINAGKIVTIYITALHEHTTDYSTTQRYNYYSLFTGLKFNLP